MIHLDFSHSSNGLLPAVAQDYRTGEVLMLAWINQEAWEKTLETGFATYFSRSRQKLWIKGEESGNLQKIREILVDCDEDAVIYRIEQIGGAACHTGHRSCFYRVVKDGVLEECGEQVFDPEQVYGKGMKRGNAAELKAAFPQLTVTENVPYREVTTFGIGGTIPILAEPVDRESLAALLQWLEERKIPRRILGGGSNFAGMDQPFPGVMIRLSGKGFASVSMTEKGLRAGGGIRLSELARQAAKLGLGGLAPLSGIPGSLGGALRMNAGANGVSIGDFVLEISGCRMDGTAWHAAGEELHWAYRSAPTTEDVIFLEAVLALPASEEAAELEAIRNESALRRKREPAGRSAGCCFRNPDHGESAGRLIDSCGLKNRQSGGVEVSSEHANFLINRANGSEDDLITLMGTISRRVAEASGIYLEPELEFADPGALARIRAAAPAPKVAVLKGGDSSEREVSLRSGAAVAAALRRAGYPVQEVDLKYCEITPEMREADVIFPVLHGGFGEDGHLQKLLEDAGLSFVGSGSEACANVMDKIASKRIMDAHALPTAPWGVVTWAYRAFPENLNFPVMVKAPCQGSSLGICKVNSIEEWDQAVEELFEYDSVLLVEEFISGAEVTVPVIDGHAYTPIEICSPTGFYDYDAKYVYQNGHTQYLCPPPSLSERQIQQAKDLALAFYDKFECRDLVRVDFIFGEDGKPYILEGNALPGCTETSLVPKAAAAAGISFAKMTANLVKRALERHN